MSERLSVSRWGDVVQPDVVLVHGSLTWGSETFAAQRPLADRYYLVLPDRYGYGGSPDATGDYPSDYRQDATAVADLLGGGAHLVGHSYGGVVALLTAAQRPDRVRSLTLIEPAAHQGAIDDPVVADAVREMRSVMDEARRRGADEYLSLAFPSDEPRPGPPGWLHRAAGSALHELPAWLAPLPLQEVANANYPKLVISGAWDVMAPEHLPSTATALRLVARKVATTIGAEWREVPGAAHDVHREQPDLLNTMLADLWSRIGQPSPPRRQ
ncbi:alpha/beta fold hydrolase [Kribbella sp. NPDC051620]|uniref:alpha/beta fold hydrolase n=1 Tax=Kribbella sp. NPDC051620 TaxID=3364120 RepID=UPI0037AC60AC